MWKEREEGEKKQPTKQNKRERQILLTSFHTLKEGAQERPQGKKCSLTFCVGRNGTTIKSLLKKWGSLRTHEGH